ncbi:hypothetical protein CD172_12045 [Staphylococcus agnetis]|nr:hypothetical protein CD172_12045 [Staphylococcus agnetis]
MVNVKDLISEIKGFGSLIYTEGEGQGNNIDFLKQKYLKALKTNGEVEINDIDFQKLIKENKVNEYHAPISSDIYSELYIGKFFNSYSELIVISPITTLSNAGATFGRFHHLIDLKYLLELEREKRYYYEKFMENDDIEMVSINELPKYPRHQNVLFNNDSFDYIVNLGKNCSKRAKDLSLDELYVGATINKLYLYSSSLNKRVLFESNNMFNFFKSSNLYRFLKEVSMESVKIIEPLNEFSIDAFSYLPRIRYKNVVLRLASWKINSSVLALPQSDEWDNLFLEYKKEFDIPNMVNLIYGDNKLLLNLELSSHRYLLMKEYKKIKEHVWLRHSSLIQVMNTHTK